MLKRLLGRKPTQTAPTIQRSSRASSRWAAVMPSPDRRVRVVCIERETESAVRVCIEPVDGGDWIYRAGQYLTHCFDIDGQTQRRPYSICVAEGARALWFACKRVDGGRVSAFVCDELAVGDEYSVRGPSGSFTLDDASGPLLFIAAGCGITPVISLIETALARDPQRAVQLIYANRDQQSIMFADRLEALTRQHGGFQLAHVLSRPQAGWDGPRGRLNDQKLAGLVSPGPDTRAYLCGQQAMMQSIRETLLGMGLSAEAVQSEAFTPAARAVQAHPTTPQTVHFARSGQSVVQAPGQSILDAALAHGVAVDYSCTVGGCAACKLRVIKGETLMDEPNCLSDSERAAGYTLACSTYALGPVEIDA